MADRIQLALGVIHGITLDRTTDLSREASGTTSEDIDAARTDVGLPLPERCDDEGKGEEPLQPGMTLGNTHPEILGRYDDVDVERSPDRSYAAWNGRIYDQIDVTQRLDDATRCDAADELAD